MGLGLGSCWNCPFLGCELTVSHSPLAWISRLQGVLMNDTEVLEGLFLAHAWRVGVF